MSSNRNIIKVYFKGTHLIYSKPQYQYNHGMILHFADLNLPQAFEAHFANKPHGNSKTVIGSDNQVEIPDEYFWSGANEIYAWVYLHSDVDDGETVFEVRIPLTKRAKPSDEEPLPEQESAINRAIAELNRAVEQTGADAEQTNSDREAVSEMRDEVSDLKDSAEESANIATQKAQEASTSASNAEDSEQEAKGYADDAKRYAENAFSSKEIAVAKASEAEGYASDAEQAKTDAEDARSDTVQLKQDVVALKEQTDTNVTHYPKIVDGYWYVWNARQNDFVNTGVEATGEKGDQGDKGDKGDKGESGVYVGDDEPLDDDYNVWVDTDDGDVVEDVVEDVQINGASIVSNGVANIPLASNTTVGVARVDGQHGILAINGLLGVRTAGYNTIKAGIDTTNSVLTPGWQAISVFYGLAKIAGHDEKDSTLSAGQYTDEAKTAIQNMLGVPSVDDIDSGLKYVKDDESDNGGVIEGFLEVPEGYPTTLSVNVASGQYSHAEGGWAKYEEDEDEYYSFPSEASGVASHAEGTSTASGFVSHAEGRTISSGDYAHSEGLQSKAIGLCSHAEGSSAKATLENSHAEGGMTTASGIDSHAQNSSTTASGNSSHSEGIWTVASGVASHAEGIYTKASSQYQHVQGKYNVEDAQNTYADIVGNGKNNNRSNAYALDWDGNGHYKGDVYVGANADSTGGTKVATLSDIPTVPVTDVQINGTSILADGVANVPVATENALGVVKTKASQTGLSISSGGTISIYEAGATTIKVGTNQKLPIVSSTQHVSTFYGLAKAAGHDEKNSTLPVGTYTEDAKSAISDMLNGSVSVSGTTPTIVAKSGIRYVCGEVASLDFTPCASGICDVVFTSGTTPTVLVVPSTVKWANGFDPSNLDADTTYELNIMDGLGVAGAWT